MDIKLHISVYNDFCLVFPKMKRSVAQALKKVKWRVAIVKLRVVLLEILVVVVSFLALDIRVAKLQLLLERLVVVN